MDKITKSLSDIERKITKGNKIIAKGDSLKFGDAIKLGAKSNSIVSTIKKSIKDYAVRSSTSICLLRGLMAL
jgi:uncharacterized protein YeeX (DUF496 family)